MAVRFIGGGNQKTQRKPPTCHKPLTNFITFCCTPCPDRDSNSQHQSWLTTPLLSIQSTRSRKVSRVICFIIRKGSCFLNKVILFTFSSKWNYFFFRYACEAHGRIILEKQYSHMPVPFVLQATVKVSQNCILIQSNIPHRPLPYRFGLVWFYGA